MLLLLNKSRVRLPAATNRQIWEAKLGKEEKRSLLNYCTILEDRGLPISRLISFAKHKQNRTILKKPKGQNNAPNSQSVLICPSESKMPKWVALWS